MIRSRRGGGGLEQVFLIAACFLIPLMVMMTGCDTTRSSLIAQVDQANEVVEELQSAQDKAEGVLEMLPIGDERREAVQAVLADINAKLDHYQAKAEEYQTQLAAIPDESGPWFLAEAVASALSLFGTHPGVIALGGLAGYLIRSIRRGRDRTKGAYEALKAVEESYAPPFAAVSFVDKPEAAGHLLATAQPEVQQAILALLKNAGSLK